ncbi:MAG: protein kinase [Planctomycetota bacterium]
MTAPIEQGRRLGEWVLEAPLGRGGFAEVWRARHNALPDRKAAVKIPFDRDYAARLRSEGVMQHVIEDPRIVRTIGLDPDHDPPYLVVDLVEGESLRDRIKRGRLDAQEALRVLREILLALDAAHKAGIVHLDLKPENVLLGASGEVKVADFGLGALTDASARALLASGSLRTSEGEDIVGTIRYMAPEQREAGHAIDARADLYAWGIVLFELLTGEIPCGAEMPSQVVPALDPRVDQIFRRCYARRESRYASARQVLDDLDALAAAPPAPAPASPIPPVRRAMRAGVFTRSVALGIDLLPFAMLALETRSLRVVVPFLLLYDTILTALTGGSVGKWLLGVRVVDREGGRPDLTTSFTRTIARTLSVASIVGPFLALGRDKQGLHDQLAGTSVEYRP